ncbi:ras and ef-hand domain-containing protein [Anaeramoeba flamelloides]|uniref:Ras and ef-hand domain-containing protein n=1 Tax=Anaeramoeba flamelloides TaxID=1746091 RepID=A0AAV7ZD11_9EUKA|nr:ras and ef-hand domain-containing protein [Anaeramoeba flamelloides]KAJ6244075.1 ras and ef-hand domain-containing protein [Anaeramoeba flamelloides]
MSKSNALKLLLIGSGKVGKSTILLRFCQGVFFESIGATVGVDFRFSDMKINNETVKLQIWDTAGQERFRTITGSYYRNADGVLVVYDITDEETFEQVEEWVKEIKKNAPPNSVVLLFANKTDLEEEREVSTEKGKDLAESLDLPFMEGSAKSGVNIQEAFRQLAEQAYQVREKNLNKSSQNSSTSTTKTRTLKEVEPEKTSGSGCC